MITLIGASDNNDANRRLEQAKHKLVEARQMAVLFDAKNHVELYDALDKWKAAVDNADVSALDHIVAKFNLAYGEALQKANIPFHARWLGLGGAA